MSRTYPRICCLLIFALASSACGSSPQSITTTATATLTQFVLPTEIPPTLSESPGADTKVPVNLTPTLTMEVSGNSTFTPTIAVSNTAHPAVLPSGPRCNDASFVDDMTIPDGTILSPEKEFTKTWRLKNTGTCRWTTSYAMGFAYGNMMGGKETKLPNSVDPGYTVDVSIDLTAPKDNGWYGGWWRLKSEAGGYFGDFVFVSILVSDGRGTNPPPPG
jgi:Ig-like domain from next to BRCA1 gene